MKRARLRLAPWLVALLGALVIAMAAPARAGEPEPAENDGSTQLIAGWIVTAFGGAAFIAGTVTGALALHKHQQLAVLCPERTCEPPLHADVDQFNALRVAATVSIAVAGTALIGGVTLLLTAPDQAQPEASAAQVRARFGPGAVVLEGAF